MLHTKTKDSELIWVDLRSSAQVKKQRCQQAHKFPRNAFEKAVKKIHGCQQSQRNAFDMIQSYLFSQDLRSSASAGQAVRMLKCFLGLSDLSSAESLERQSRTAYKSLISEGGSQRWADEVRGGVSVRLDPPTTVSHKSLLLSCVWFKAHPNGNFDTGYVERARTN